MCALLRLLSTLSAEELYTHVQSLHHYAQGKLGSGTDIAASVWGGILRYRWQSCVQNCLTPKSHSEFDSPFIPIPSFSKETFSLDISSCLGWGQVQDLTTTHSWLKTRPLLCVWTEASAKTPHFVSQLRQWKARFPLEYQRHLQAIAEAEKQGIQAIQDQSNSALCYAIQRGAQAIQDLTQASQIPMWTPVHQELKTTLQSQNAVIKTTGAGGGDLAWIRGQDREHEQYLFNSLSQAGWTCLWLEVAPSMYSSID